MTKLEFSEQLLKLEKDTVWLFGMYLLVVNPLVDSLAELRRHEESLQEAVNIAGGADVG